MKPHVTRGDQVYGGFDNWMRNYMHSTADLATIFYRYNSIRVSSGKFTQKAAISAMAMNYIHYK